MAATAQVRKKAGPLIFWIILGVMAALGIAVGILRLVQGLGATTNLSNTYPWGLWIVFDFFLIPFSAGAFTMALIANLLNREKYHAIARPVILAGLLGYIGVVVVLLIDLARWHQFYNFLWPGFWNLHSFMLEVSLCITLYTVVLLLEMSPAIWERFRLKGAQRVIRSLTVWIAGAGVVLSTLHQTSLGSVFVLMRYTLHGLWWSPLLPLFFFLSSIIAGLSMIILVTLITARAYGYPEHIALLPQLAKASAILLGIYLVLKVGDVIVRGSAGLLFGAGTMSLLFWLEIIVGVVIPMVLFAQKRTRESTTGLLWGAVCTTAGLLLNRANVSLFALQRAEGAQYLPSWIEFAVALGTLALVVIAYALLTRYLPVNEERKPAISQEVV